jgi:HEPN domain-containing protein
MTVPSEVLHVVGQWVDKAEEDLTNAEYTLTMEDRCPFGTVCFHAQQCVEKYLKALLTLHSIPFPKTHNLTELGRLAGRAVELDLEQVDLVYINRFSTEARYPGDWEPITRVEAKQAVAIARKLRGLIGSHLPIDVTGDSTTRDKD